MSDPITNAAISVATKAGTEVVNNASKGIGQTVSDMWYSIYGYKWSEKRQKKEIEVAHNVEKFKEEITNKSAQIPDENRIEPDIDVIGSTLESARFRINKDEIRDMFSNLIVSAMDSSKADDIHPSFSEMIKMLNPLDAQNLYYLYHNKDETISSIRETNTTNGGYTEPFKHIFLGNPKCQDHTLIEPSIDNLIRLKLVDVTYNAHKNDESLYNKHRENSIILELKARRAQEIQSYKDTLNYFNEGGRIEGASQEQQALLIENLKKLSQDTTIDIQKGIIRLTALGRNFCKVCL